MDWLLYMLLTSVELCYWFKEISKKGYMNNYRKEKPIECSLEEAKRIPDSDCCPHEITLHAYCVRSQTMKQIVIRNTLSIGIAQIL